MYSNIQFGSVPRWRYASISVMIFVMIFTLDQEAEACFRSGFVTRQRSSSSKIFVRDEYHPVQQEDNWEASGRLDMTNMVTDESKMNQLVLVRNRPGLEFKRGSTRWMTEGCLERLLSLVSTVQETWPGQGVSVRVIRAWEAPPKELFIQYEATRKHPRNRRNRKKKNKNIPELLPPKNKTTDDYDDGDDDWSVWEQLSLQDKKMDRFHWAGQAVDLEILGGGRDVHLGRLASLAYFRALFDWCIYSKYDYIHCSVKSAAAEEEQWLGCFPGNALVRTPSSLIPMSEINVGDQIQVIDASGRLVFSPVLHFLHRDPQASQGTSLVRIQTKNGSHLSLTPDHLIYTLPQTHNSSNATNDYSFKHAVFASSLQPRNIIFVVKDNQRVELDYVVSMEWQKVGKRGVYAPLTREGNLVVNGVLASSFSHISSESLAKFVYQPYILMDAFKQVWTSTLQGEVGESNATDGVHVLHGVHWYAQLMWNIGSWVLPSNMFYTSMRM